MHFYTTNEAEKTQAMSRTPGNCYNFDGIEGYVSVNGAAPMEPLYRLYNAGADSFILVPSSQVGLANSLGYTYYQTQLGWVYPN